MIIPSALNHYGDILHQADALSARLKTARKEPWTQNHYITARRLLQSHPAPASGCPEQWRR
jgi:hypothetical protein